MESASGTKSQLNAWSNEECQLLLNIALQYKNRYMKQSFNWHPTMHFQYPSYYTAMQMANCTGPRNHQMKEPSNMSGRVHPQHNMNKNINQNLCQPKPHDDSVPFYLDLYSRLFLETESDSATVTRNVNPYTNFLNAAAPYDMKTSQKQSENRNANIHEENSVVGKSRKTTKSASKLKERIKRKKFTSNVCKPVQNEDNHDRLRAWFKRKSLGEEEEEEKKKIEERKNDIHMQAVFQQVKMQSQLINEGYLLMRSMLTPDSSDSYDMTSHPVDGNPMANHYQTSYHMTNNFPHMNNMFPEQAILGNL